MNEKQKNMPFTFGKGPGQTTANHVHSNNLTDVFSLNFRRRKNDKTQKT